jgi:hypothetical protein
MSDPEAALEAMRAERDDALRKLDVTTNAWRSTILTKDALAELAQISPADVMVVQSHIARAERAENTLKSLTNAEGVLAVVRDYLATLTDEGREKFFYEMEQGYCGACGRKLNGNEPMGCQCTNDE